MIDHFRAKFGAQLFFGHGKAHGIGNALPQRTGRGFDPLGMAIFRVARRDRAPLAEITDLIERHVFVTRQVQKRI